MTSKQWVDIYHKTVPTREDREKVNDTLDKLQERFITKCRRSKDNPQGLTIPQLAKRLKMSKRNVDIIIKRMKNEKISKN